MTIQEYKDAGYEMANQVTSVVIAKAEKDVFNSYVKPIIGSDADEDDYKDEIMALAFCLMLRRTFQKTRFGAEQKRSQYGISDANEALQQQIVGFCVPAVKSLIEQTRQDKPFNNVSDIIGFGYYIV